MDARSRPTPDDIREISDLYTYMYTLTYVGKTKPI